MGKLTDAQAVKFARTILRVIANSYSDRDELKKIAAEALRELERCDDA